MKKKILLCYLCLTKLSLGGTVTLESLLDYVDRTSYKNDIYRVKKNKNKERKEIYKRGDYNGIQSNLDSEYDTDKKIYKNTGRIQYGNFYMEGEKWKDEDSNLKIGAEKNLKDIVYSKNKNNLEKIELEDQLNSVENKRDLENEKIKLINLYKEYMNVKLELDIRKNALKYLKREKGVIERSYELGATAKVDLDSLLSTYKNTELEIEDLEKQLLNLKEQFKYSFNIDLNGKELKPIDDKGIDIDRYIKNIGGKELKNSELQKAITEKNIQYMSYDNRVPNLSVGLEHQTDNNDNRVYLKLDKKLFYKDEALENEKSDLEEQKIELAQKRRDMVATQLEYKNKYYTLLKECNVLKNSKKLEEEKYNIKFAENSYGKTRYLDVMDSFEDYLEIEIQEAKAQNNLNALIYEIKIKGENRL